MKWYHQLWVVPLCITLGYSLGLYYSIPQDITIDTGENLKYFADKMDNLSINSTNCPDCLCDCGTNLVDDFWNLYYEEHTMNCDTDRDLDFIMKGIMRLENNTKCILKANEGYGWFLERE